MRSEQIGHAVAVGNVELLKLEIGKTLELSHTPLFQARIVVGIEIVEAQYLAAVRQQAAHDVHPDEAGSAGDKDRIRQDYPSLARRCCRSLQCRAAMPRKKA